MPKPGVYRSPWRDFPDVVIQTTVHKLRSRPAYEQAKRGAGPAGFEVVQELIKPEKIPFVFDTVVPVMQFDRDKPNAFAFCQAARVAGFNSSARSMRSASVYWFRTSTNSLPLANASAEPFCSAFSYAGKLDGSRGLSGPGATYSPFDACATVSIPTTPSQKAATIFGDPGSTRKRDFL